jgi:diaminohydroxyphosphoribosylaminopyrimidine deaminase/5-amino-6-(5-phosphoribosylamino)uracil reductase
VAATDPNPKHAGRAYTILEKGGIGVTHGVRADEANLLNEAFNHWILRRTPWVTVKAALTLDGKIATATGQSRWITSEAARAYGTKLRQGADAILVGVNTVLADDPKLTVRRGERELGKPLRRVVLDARARTPLESALISDRFAERTTIVVSETAPAKRVSRLTKRVRVLIAPRANGRVEVGWLLSELGRECVTSLLVEGGGEVNASFLLGGFAHRIAFFYAPKIIGGRSAPGAVGGHGVTELARAIQLGDLSYRRLGADLLLTARVLAAQASEKS